MRNDRAATYGLRAAPLSPPARAALYVAAGAAAGAMLLYLLMRRAAASGALIGPDSRVALIGDSFAVGLGPELTKLAGTIPFQFEGHVGTTPKQWADHASACGNCGDWLTAYKPTHVLVSLGTNDMGSTPSAAYYENLRDGIQSIGATPVWIEPPWMPNDRLATVRRTIESLGVSVFPAAHIPISADNVHPKSYAPWAKSLWNWLRGG